MPPKVKITREDIINATLQLVRTSGAQAINARAVASALGCSTQPVFSNFATMEDLHLAVEQKAVELYREYSRREIDAGTYPVYKASGISYIRFAKEEKELFKLLFMCDRTAEAMQQDSPLFDEMVDAVHSSTGLEIENAKLLHLEVWAFVHGIATMFATGFLELEWDLVSKMLTDIYQGLRKQYTTE
jgi:AcrR family transcriptional regulator